MIYYYAFRNKRTGRLVSDTDRRYHPYHQIYVDEWNPPLLVADDYILAKTVYKVRRMCKDIEIIKVDLILQEVDET